MDMDFEIRRLALQMAEAQYQRAGAPYTADDLISVAQHYEVYLREGRTMHPPSPQQAKAA